LSSVLYALEYAIRKVGGTETERAAIALACADGGKLLFEKPER
jgi:hypothetical protein